MPEQDAAGAPQKKRTSQTPLDRIMARDAARDTNASFYERVIQPWGDRALAPGGKLAKNFDLDAIRYRLMRGGFPRGLRAQDFALLKLGLTVGLALAFPVLILPLFATVFGWDITPMMVIGAAIVGALYGFKAPDLWLSTIVRKRQSEIVLVMPT